MFKQKLNLTGQKNKYGCIAIREKSKDPVKGYLWVCKCPKCGKEFEIYAYNFKGQKSCGCLREEMYNNLCAESSKLAREVRENGTIQNTSIINILPQKIRKDSTSGIRGVSWNSRSRKWIAYISFQKTRYNLGSYETIEEAALARKEAENHLYGNFFKWFAEKYPDKWKIIKCSYEKKHDKINI